MNIHRVKSLRHTFPNEGHPDDKTRYIVTSAQPITADEAMACFNQWAKSHVMYVSSREEVLIDYEAWLPEKEVPQSLKEILFVDEHERQIWQMTSAERATLFFLLSQINPQCSIEIGSSNGGSLAVLSQFSQIVYSLDIDPTCKTRLGPRFSNVEFITGDSRATLVPLLHRLQTENSTLEFVLIDGDHTAEGIKHDIENVLQFKPNQPVYILMHDSFNPEVRAGIQSANWQDCLYVHWVELDLVPGILLNRMPFHRQMWGGFAFALLRPVVRRGKLELSANQAPLQQAAIKQSAHNPPGSVA